MFLELINEHFNKLNENDLDISNFIIHNMDQIHNFTAQELADELYLSKTSLIRFCQKLEFKGYSDLKIYIENESKKAKHITENKINKYVVTDNKKTLDYLQQVDWKELFAKLDETKEIYILPTGISQRSQADELSRLFFLIGKKCDIIFSTSRNEFSRMLEFVNRDSLFILLSLSGENNNLR